MPQYRQKPTAQEDQKWISNMGARQKNLQPDSWRWRQPAQAVV